MSSVQNIDLNGLPKILKETILKRGHFLMSTGEWKPYWVDMFYLSHLFNESEHAKTFYKILKGLILDIIICQKRLGINAIISPRWTCSTDDLFAETLLNICFDLFRDNPKELSGLTLYELFRSGVKDIYYLNKVKGEQSKDGINAVAFMALDIHVRLIDGLLNSHKNSGLKIDSVISVIGRCEPTPRSFMMIPLFDAWNNGNTLNSEFMFIMNKESSLHKALFNGQNAGYRRYIPFDDWEKRYKNG